MGGIGLQLGQDIERVSAEIGYWLGQDHWGRGLATAAVRSVTEYAFETVRPDANFRRAVRRERGLDSCPGEGGLRLEGHLRRSAIKDGVICDQRLYARYK